MGLKFFPIYIGVFFFWSLSGQIQIDTLKHSHFIAPEIMIGQLSEPNTDFPEVGLQKSFFLNFGAYQKLNNQEWAYRLNYPQTGISFGFSEYGNPEDVGKSYSIIPNASFNLFNSNRFKLLFGLGLSYHNVQYDIRRNPYNKGISTEFA